MGLLLALVMPSALLAGGCDEELPNEGRPPAYIVGANPPLGSEVPCGSPINLVYNRDPGLVRSLQADLDPASQTGTRRRFRIGGDHYTVEFLWGDSETVTAYHVSCEAVPVTLVGTTPDTFEPSASVLNEVGLVLHFDRPLRSVDSGWPETFSVEDSAGNVWRPTVSADGADVTVRPAVGRALVAGERNHLTGRVQDKGGNVTEVDLEFPVVKGDA